MILGTPSKLQSQFRLTYNMILNLLRVEALRVEEMIKRSFSENASQRLLPENQKKIVEVGRRVFFVHFGPLHTMGFASRLSENWRRCLSWRATFVLQTSSGSMIPRTTLSSRTRSC